MLMRLPESGSLIGAVVNGMGHTAADGSGIAVDAVSEPQLVEALDALARGDIEYVILEDGEAFLQAAGAGDGPYALQFSRASGDGMVEVPGGVPSVTMRTALLGYRRGDAGWRGASRWSAL
jgi:hypothetical protein